MKLNDLVPNEGSKKNRKRVGRGPSAGQGKTAGRGTKGAALAPAKADVFIVRAVTCRSIAACHLSVVKVSPRRINSHLMKSISISCPSRLRLGPM